MAATTTQQIVDLTGTLIDARFSVGYDNDELSIIVDSRGGTSDGGNARNLQYAFGLDTLLRRLAYRGAIITDAVVDSSVTRAMDLTRADRRLMIERQDYPLRLTPDVDINSLRLAMCAAQRGIGRRPQAKGLGNNTKRIRLYVDFPALDRPDLQELSEYLTGWASPIARSPHEIEAASINMDFDPRGIVDARRRCLAAMVVRQGQPAFRRKLLEAYGGCCSLSGCNVDEVLEAAHICPYRGPNTNEVQNGLLLRSDLHVLFDRGLIAVDSAQWRVVIAHGLMDTCYKNLSGAPFSLPTLPQDRPSRVALAQHRSEAAL